MVEPGKDVVCCDKATGLEFCPLICQQSYDLCIHVRAHTYTPLYLIRGLRVPAVEVFLQIYLSEEAAPPETHNGRNLGDSDLLGLASVPPSVYTASSVTFTCVITLLPWSTPTLDACQRASKWLYHSCCLAADASLATVSMTRELASQPHTHHESWACRILSPARQAKLERLALERKYQKLAPSAFPGKAVRPRGRDEDEDREAVSFRGFFRHF